MDTGKRIRDFGVNIGSLPTGEKNTITDVTGVLVGHATIDTKENKTGVTVITPTSGNIYTRQLVAASYVMNGYGKTLGLVQIDELGTLETPIALTNTLNVGIVHDSLVEYTLQRCEKEGKQAKSINAVVGETNDCLLNNITKRAVTANHVQQAFLNASADFEQGDVGAGKGTVCYGLKGGIGSSSRIIMLGEKEYTVGVLVQSNFGKCADLTIAGRPVGQQIVKDVLPEDTRGDKGSIMVIVATDAPVCSRQLGRILRRGALGLARTGSYGGHGSGDVFIGFSTANIVEQSKEIPIHTISVLSEELLDYAFRATVEAVEEAVLNSMTAANTVTGYDGAVRYGIAPFLEKYLIL